MFQFVKFVIRTLIKRVKRSICLIDGENCHYINKSEEKNPRKLTSEAKVKKKTPDSDLGKPLLGWPQARRALLEEIRRIYLQNWVRKGDYWGRRAGKKSQKGYSLSKPNKEVSISWRILSRTAWSAAGQGFGETKCCEGSRAGFSLSTK